MVTARVVKATKMKMKYSEREQRQSDKNEVENNNMVEVGLYSRAARHIFKKKSCAYVTYAYR